MPPQDSPETNPQQKDPRDDAPSAQSVRKELHWLEILNFIGQLVLAIVGIIAVVVYGKQLKEMRHTNDLTRAALEAANQNSLESSKQFQVQLGHFDASMGRTELLAIHAGEQAKAGQDAANAARSAADTAKEALHVSQRAYLVLGIPMIHTTIPRMTIPIDNIGHIVTGKVTIISQGAVLTGVSTTTNNAMNNGWGEINMTIAPGSGKDSVNIPLFTLDANRVNNGTQFIFAAGTISYNDGFPGTPIQVVKFCWRSMAVVSATPGVPSPTPSDQMQFDKCDPDAIIPMMEKWDENYNPKYKWPNLPPY
jgi:hypothetical protein